MIGMVLSNRYKLLEKIGEGGMALVFRAKDSLLGRVVAVKVLRPQFASDDEFVERFRREATSAASLSHPNVVNIYDVGQDDQTYFIVMEYVEGVNLKDIIKDRAPMPATEVVAIGRQIVEALEHAHRRDIIHRDVKPHNILVTGEGRVKVTDFGIARAASRSSLTQTGMIMGSVHYFSPEQARGATTGIQSDLYSVGVVLYEMVTGTVPFKGDTPISVALAHIQDEAPSVRSLNPAVPAALERVIMRALSKDLDRRYESGDAMLRDLYIAGAQANEQATDGDMDTTRVMGAARVGLAASSVDEPTLIRAGRGEVTGQDPGKRTRPRWVAPLAITSIVLMALAILGVFGPQLLFGRPEVEVPRFEGLSFKVAEQRATGLGLVLVRDGEAWDSRVPANHVISQQPPAGRIVKRGRHALVVVSKGAQKVTVPDLSGQPVKDAEATLAQADLEMGRQTNGFSAEVPLGLVVSQLPAADAKVEKGSSVDIVLSQGAEPSKITMPNFIGQSLPDVQQLLATYGLTEGKVVPEYSDTVDPDIVIDQFPAAQELVDPKQVVNLVVSQGPETATPDGSTQPVPKKFRVKVPVPTEGPGTQEVKIVVQDDLGARTVYQQNHKPGDEVSPVVETYGSGSITVYVGGKVALVSPVKP